MLLIRLPNTSLVPSNLILQWVVVLLQLAVLMQRMGISWILTGNGTTTGGMYSYVSKYFIVLNANIPPRLITLNAWIVLL